MRGDAPGVASKPMRAMSAISSKDRAAHPTSGNVCGSAAFGSPWLWVSPWSALRSVSSDIHAFNGGSIPCPKMIALTTFRAKPTQPMIMTRRGFSTAVANVSLPRVVWMQEERRIYTLHRDEALD